MSTPDRDRRRPDLRRSYEDFTHFDNGRDDYEVAELDPGTGARSRAPFKVDTLIDGATDYPIALGRQTYQDACSDPGPPATSPPTPPIGAHLAVDWSDMRNSPLPAPATRTRP